MVLRSSGSGCSIVCPTAWRTVPRLPGPGSKLWRFARGISRPRPMRIFNERSTTLLNQMIHLESVESAPIAWRTGRHASNTRSSPEQASFAGSLTVPSPREPSRPHGLRRPDDALRRPDGGSWRLVWSGKSIDCRPRRSSWRKWRPPIRPPHSPSNPRNGWPSASIGR